MDKRFILKVKETLYFIGIILNKNLLYTVDINNIFGLLQIFQ